MKLQVPFVQLPLKFDADLLAEEIATLDEKSWRPHPQGYPGNSALPLVSVGGDPASDALRGAMAPTPFLERCPYLMQVLESLGVTVGRTRLMRLSGQAEVSPHVDTAYYWWQRVRVHVPITTQPTVLFMCGDAEINMAAGECWLFDTWRMHRVINDAERSRVHLVVDTVGGPGLENLLKGGRTHDSAVEGWSFQATGYRPKAAKPELRFEKSNLPSVMTPWEVREYLRFLLMETIPEPRLRHMQAMAEAFDREWQALWAWHGESHEGWPHYRRALNTFRDQMRLHSDGVRLRNDTLFNAAFSAGFLRAALDDANDAVELGEPREAMKKPTASDVAMRTDPVFDRPIFIVSAPRSGSTLLFETLAKAPNVFTIGGESHGMIEGISALHPAAHDFNSNRLDASAATSVVAAELRERFRAALVDRDGVAAATGRVRMLEKTPKNALRIPFLAQVFPEAHFVYLHRDVRETLSSMHEAWKSGRFKTYPQLPGWSGLPWSLLLIPGWRDLIGKPLHEIVATQWEATTRIQLDDLEGLPQERWSVTRYDALLADPNAEISRLCGAVGFGWDKAFDGDLPLSRYTLSKPDPQKWRKNEDVLEPVMPRISETVLRAEQFAS
jgi:hypothetical protein